ncbi:unnamed protein product [Vitrella brassicaformis CCMP3155]|uniref:Sas10 C-terminal domain-containing protein n=2 Tax=Vitrella brassicaformis TaxID=1169539 RepID=A0A0G4GJQ5_VITBC|nr:unnamed protein product [Vitrella brassicaformis CCMP3155]|eukprot:CEM30154.1 unnamed protein product [Vitrella brassicaformis CCMP3155]
MKRSAKAKRGRGGASSSGIEKYGLGEVDAHYQRRQAAAEEGLKIYDDTHPKDAGEDEYAHAMDALMGLIAEEDEDEDTRKLRELAEREREAEFAGDDAFDEGEDQEEDEDDSGTAPRAAWGRKARDFYDEGLDHEGVDESDEESDEAGALEEARLIQKQRAAKMSQVLDIGTGQLDLLAKEMAGGELPDEAEEKNLAQSVQNELEALASGMHLSGGLSVERIRKDVASLSVAEKRRLVREEHPEMVGLLTDFKHKIHLLQTTLLPAMDAIRANPALVTHEGRQLIELWTQVLLSYHLHFCYYLAMKGEGRSITEHPVVERLVQLRTLDEELSKMGGDAMNKDISTLLRIAATGKKRGNDDGQQSIEKREADRKAQRETNASKAANGPRVLKRSEIVAAAMRRMATKEVPLSNDEEHLPSTREPDLTREPTEQEMARFSTEGLDGDLDDPSLMPKFGKKPTLAQYLNIARQAKGSLDRSKVQKSADENVAFKERRKRADKASAMDLLLQQRNGGTSAQNNKTPDTQMFADEVDVGMGDGDDGEDEMEEEGGNVADIIAQQMRANKAKKVHKKELLKERSLQHINAVEETSQGKRGTTYQIMKNKGLTRKRKKIEGNARVKHRYKYDQALKRRKGQVRAMQEGAADGTYAGEETGIRARVHRSTKLA